MNTSGSAFDPPPGLPRTPGPGSTGPLGAASPDLQLPTFSTAAQVRVIVTFILCGVSALCNVAVVWAASGHVRGSHVRVLILHLTAADLLVTFIVMPVDAVWNVTVQWLAGDAACRLLMFLKLQAMYSCAFVTVVISLDRQSAILNPLGISEAGQRNRVMLGVAWSMSLLLSAPQIFLFHSVTITYPQNFTQCTTRGSFRTHGQETAYNMLTFCCLFLLPLIIMITCYSRILLHISRMHKDSLSNHVPLRCSRNNIPRARVRTLKMSVVIVLCFIVCWTPYYLLGLWYWFFPDHIEGKVSSSLTHILFTFGLFSACLDPIIYGLFTVRFRKGLRGSRGNAGAASDHRGSTRRIIMKSLKCSAASLAGETRSAASQAGEMRSAASRAGETHSATSRAGETRSATSRARETHSATSRAGETRSVASRARETHSATSRAGETRSVASRARETSSAASQAGETSSAGV